MIFFCTTGSQGSTIESVLPFFGGNSYVWTPGMEVNHAGGADKMTREIPSCLWQAWALATCWSMDDQSQFASLSPWISVQETWRRSPSTIGFVHASPPS